MPLAFALNQSCSTEDSAEVENMSLIANVCESVPCFLQFMRKNVLC